MRLIERLAGFGRMEQRLQLCFEGKKLFGPRPLIEPVDERIYGKIKQRRCDFGMEISPFLITLRCGVDCAARRVSPTRSRNGDVSSDG